MLPGGKAGFSLATSRFTHISVFLFESCISKDKLCARKRKDRKNV
jgi:hypothetical protein